MNIHDKTVQRFWWKLALLIVLKQTLTLLTLWAFLWGTAVLVLRAAVGIPPEPLLWGLAGVPLALAASVMLARRRWPSRSGVRALLDRHSGSGGLLMAGEELSLGGWNTAMPELTLPQVRWQGGRAWTLFAVALAYLLLGFLVPERFAALGASAPLEIGKEVEKLANQIAVLKEEAILEPERAEALNKELDQLKEKSSGKDPVKTLEALDHLQAFANKTAKDAAETATRKTEQLAKTETLADALRESGPALEEKTSAEAMKELSELVQKAAQENHLLDKHLDPETAKACKACKLSSEQLKKLAKALKAGKKDLAKQLEKLCKAGLLDPEALKECDKCAECDCEALAQCLKECQGKMTVAEMLKKHDGKPGKGGTKEGYTKSPLTLGPETSEEGLKFKEEALPPAALKALKENKLAGVGKADPKADKPGGPSEGGALTGAMAGGGSANTQVILPRHRGAVERFFERKP